MLSSSNGTFTQGNGGGVFQGGDVPTKLLRGKAESGKGTAEAECGQVKGKKEGKARSVVGRRKVAWDEVGKGRRGQTTQDLGSCGPGKELDFIPRGRRVLGSFQGWGVIVKWSVLYLRQLPWNEALHLVQALTLSYEALNPSTWLALKSIWIWTTWSI